MYIQNEFPDTAMLQARIFAVVYRYKAAILLQYEHTAVRKLTKFNFKLHTGLFHSIHAFLVLQKSN
jgi:hypothetical protein